MLTVRAQLKKLQKEEIIFNNITKSSNNSQNNNNNYENNNNSNNNNNNNDNENDNLNNSSGKNSFDYASYFKAKSNEYRKTINTSSFLPISCLFSLLFFSIYFIFIYNFLNLELIIYLFIIF